MLGIDENRVFKPVNIALLTECRLMDPVRYKFIEDNHKLFNYIVTYDDQLIEKFKEKVIITPYGGTWIWPKEKQQIYPKSKLCSFITSKKKFIPGHEFRVSMLDNILVNYKDKID